MKKSNNIIQRNTSPSKTAGGDFYGSGIKNPVGKARDVFLYGSDSDKDDLSDPKKFPKSL